MKFDKFHFLAGGKTYCIHWFLHHQGSYTEKQTNIHRHGIINLCKKVREKKLEIKTVVKKSQFPAVLNWREQSPGFWIFLGFPKIVWEREGRQITPGRGRDGRTHLLLIIRHCLNSLFKCFRLFYSSFEPCPNSFESFQPKCVIMTQLPCILRKILRIILLAKCNS